MVSLIIVLGFLTYWTVRVESFWKEMFFIEHDVPYQLKIFTWIWAIGMPIFEILV